MLFFHFLIMRTSPVTNIASTRKSDIGIAVAVEVMHPKYLGIMEWKQLVMVDELMILYMIILTDAFNTMHIIQCI